MSEINDRNPETTAEEMVENTPEVQEAPAQDAASKPRKKKKRKGAKVALPVVALMLVIALFFGAVVGYITGRGAVTDRLQEAEKQLAALTVAFEEAAGAPAYDAFTEELTDENRTALSELSGAAYDDGVEDILGEDELLGEMLEAGEVQAPVVVAEYKGGTLMSDEVAREYEDQMSSLVLAGYSEEEIAETLLDEVLTYMVGDRVLESKAKELGLYDLTDADKAAIAAEAEAVYAEQIAFYRDYVNTEGMTDEEATGAVKSYLQENEGITLDGIREELESGWWVEKLYNEITQDVQVSDQDVQQHYDHLVQDQQESFTAYADDYEFAQMSGETIVYNLDGYRAVRMLLFSFDDFEDYEAVLALSDELPQLDPEKDAEMIADYQAQIEACYAPVQAEAQAALDQIASGADFEQLLADLGDDEGMKDAYLAKSGYHVSKDSLLWPQEFISAAMALEKPGDISDAIRIADGVCILQYVGEVPAGAVALEDVKDQLQEDVLLSAQFSAYETQLDAWLQEAEAVYYPERMQ